MKTALIPAAALVIATALTPHGALAQLPGVMRKDLQRHDLSIPGHEMVQALVGISPGTTAPRHSHPGEEIVYVVDGVLEYRIDGEPPATLKAGDTLFIPAGAIHAVTNVGDSDATELATYIVEKGKPLIEIAKQRRSARTRTETSGH